MLKQVVSDENLATALNWLQESSSKQDNVWDYSRDWQEHKTALQQQVLNGQLSL